MSKDEIQTSLRMSKELLKRLKQYALDHDISLATVVREACEEYLKKHK
jgi:predicted DNA-binding protein